MFTQTTVYSDCGVPGLLIPEEPKRGVTVISVSVWKMRFSPRRVQMFDVLWRPTPGAANTQRTLEGRYLQGSANERDCC